LSKIIVELVERDSGFREEGWTKYYNLANPKMSRWEELVPDIQELYASSSGIEGQVIGKQTDGLEIVTLEEWVKRLEASSRKKNVDIVQNLALELLDFFKGLKSNGTIAKLDTKGDEEGV
jgi:hypothetical protein